MLYIYNKKLIQYRNNNILNHFTVEKTPQLIINIGFTNISFYFGSNSLYYEGLGCGPVGALGVRSFHSSATANGKITDFIKGIFRKKDNNSIIDSDDGELYYGPVPKKSRFQNIEKWRNRVPERDQLLDPRTSVQPPLDDTEVIETNVNNNNETRPTDTVTDNQNPPADDGGDGGGGGD